MCSERDRERLVARPGAEVCDLPDGVPAVESVAPRPRDGRPFTLLFVGTLGYCPNKEGLVYIGTEVLPRLRRSCQSPFRLRSWERVRHRPSRSCAVFRRSRSSAASGTSRRGIGEPDAVILPLRAGGGTRIKVLEAFAHR